MKVAEGILEWIQVLTQFFSNKNLSFFHDVAEVECIYL